MSKDRQLVDAVFDGDVEAVERLLSQGANANQPLAVAAAADCVFTAILRMLLDAGGDPNAATPSGFSALMGSASSPEQAKLLLGRGAAVDQENDEGETALFVAARACGSRVDVFSDSYEDHAAGKRTLVASYPSGEKPYEVMAILLEHGADVNHRDKNGKTALAQAKTSRAAKMLRDAGARG